MAATALYCALRAGDGMTARAEHEHRIDLEARTRHEVCACGRDLVVAYKDDVYRLRCEKCGLDPMTVTRRKQKAALVALLRSFLPRLEEADAFFFTGVISSNTSIEELRRCIGLAQKAIRHRANLA